MKTPIEEAIEILKGSEDKTFKVSEFIEVLNNILPKEREHICEAFSNGVNEGLNGLEVYNKSIYYDKKYTK